MKFYTKTHQYYCGIDLHARKMRFEEAYGGWQKERLTQEETARLLGVCERTFFPAVY